MGNGEEYLEDFEREGLKESLFLYEKKMEVEEEYWEWFKKQKAIVLHGKSRKKRNFNNGRATVKGKIPRFIQYRSGRVSSISKEWY